MFSLHKAQTMSSTHNFYRLRAAAWSLPTRSVEAAALRKASSVYELLGTRGAIIV